MEEIKKDKRLRIYSEIPYFLSLLSMSLAVAMATCANFGVSMIVAPAYIISMKLNITFGQAEYIVQAILFIIFCLVMKKFRFSYLFSFITGLLYGALLDLWMWIIPHFNPNITPPGSLPLWLNIIYYSISIILTALAVALAFKTYIYPQIYDFFVKGITDKYRKIKRNIFKILFDFSFLLLALLLTLLFFQGIKGIGIGTVICAFLNGLIITFFDKMLDKIFVFKPLINKFSDYLEIKED